LREQALAAARQGGPDVWAVREGRLKVVVQNTRLPDLILEYLRIV
jgi:hypothetical protein